MGQPMPDEPHEYGNDCALKFAANETPKYMFARFSKLTKCLLATVYPPNDRMFKLTQAPGAPCFWWYDIAPWSIWMEYIEFPISTRLHITHTPSAKHYFTNQVMEYTNEGYVFTNEYLACGAQNWAIDGIGVVTWTHQATKLLDDINMEKAADLFMELRPLDDGKLVYKFCKLQDTTNIAILFEP